MIFQYTLDQILNSTKTQTRRIIKPNETPVRGQYNRIICVYSNSKVKWEIGRTYSVQPGRGQSQVARFEITRIRSEKITRITTKDAILEGFSSRSEFLSAWKTIHGPNSLTHRVWVIEFRVITQPNSKKHISQKHIQPVPAYAS